VAGGHEDEQWVSGALPLTERLERAFAARVSDLPDATRLVLRVAALNDSDSISEVLHAGSFIAGTALDLDLPAAEAAIVELDLQTLRFRHPLIRSAVRQSASVPQRRRVHEALAETLEAEPSVGSGTAPHRSPKRTKTSPWNSRRRGGARSAAGLSTWRSPRCDGRPSSVTMRTEDADSSRRASSPSSSVSPNSQRSCCVRSMSRTGQSSARSRPGSRR
jgi:hypothetical protein